MSSEDHVPQAGEHHHMGDRLGRALGAGDELPTDPDLLPAGLSRRRGVAVAFVGIGGFFGTFARFGVEQAWPSVAGHLPWATFVINVSGAFLLGLLIEVLIALPKEPMLRPLLGTGLLGGWTTYSTFAVETVVLGKGGDLAVALEYILLSFAASGIAVAFGVAFGRWLRTAPVLREELAESGAD
jgi:CrcB protein